ncbi:MAG TPA: ImmA/IrrE family metallo-endopeptidase [Streptosporangiaceae bacterium]|nr:ImmA/IrrE family metallo-endopeptidase [Streptosporangiaceae bacterium]
MTLRRGFLAEAERHATRIRSELGRDSTDQISMQDVAKHLGIRVISADELIDVSRLHELERIQAFAFSACTFDIKETKVIVFNPIRTAERRESDVGHEVSHVLLGHELSALRTIDGTPFRTCQPDQEEEATNLAGTLLLPRPLLFCAVKQGLGEQEIAQRYGVSVEMARFRLNRTAVAKQIRSGRTLQRY